MKIALPRVNGGSRLWPAAVATFLLATTLQGAEPTVSHGAPRWGNSVRLPPYSLTTLPTTLRNDSDEVRDLLISISPERAQDGTVVNQRLLQIGPNASLRDNLRFLSYPTETYISELIDARSDSLLARDHISSAHQSQVGDKKIFILDDSESFQVATEMTRLQLLSERVQVTRSRAVDAPYHWIDYGPSSLLLLVEPDFLAMNDFQFQAIRDFVLGGGLLLFTHPATIAQAAQTPLADLLPVDPMDLRLVETLPALEAWLAAGRGGELPNPTAPLHWPAGLLFLESVLRDDAHAALWQDQYPLLAWQPAGAGLVGVCTFDASDRLFELSQAGGPLWNHVLSWSAYHPLSEGAVFAPPLEQAADRLTGFQAADADSIQMLLAGNMLFVVLVLLLARLFRRQATGWLMLGGYGIVLTSAIFYAAFKQMEEQPRRNLIVLEIMSRQADRRVGLHSISVFNQQDSTPHLATTSSGAAFIPAVAPNIDRNPVFMFQSRPSESLQIRREHGTEYIRNFSVSALRRRTAGYVFTSRSVSAAAAAPVAARPILHYQENGPRLRNFTLPDTLPADTMLYLTGGNGTRLLRSVGNGEWEMEEDTSRVFQLNPVFTRFQEFIAGNWLPPNRLVLLYPNRNPEFKPPFMIQEEDDYHRVLYTLELLAPRPVIDSGSIAVPSEMIAVKPAERSAQTLFWQDDESFITSTGTYLFSAHLPSFMAGLQPREVTVDVRILNPDGNLRVNIELLPYTAQQTADNGPKPEPIAGTEIRPGRFAFSGPQLANLVNPTDGRFFLRLSISPNSDSETATLSSHTMQWRLLDLGTRVQGNQPASPQQSDDGV